jgi:hypothetical protein
VLGSPAQYIEGHARGRKLLCLALIALYTRERSPFITPRGLVFFGHAFWGRRGTAARGPPHKKRGNTGQLFEPKLLQKKTTRAQEKKLFSSEPFRRELCGADFWAQLFGAKFCGDLLLMLPCLPQMAKQDDFEVSLRSYLS